MCYAVRIVVVASTRERRLALRRAAVSAEWEVVGDAEDLGASVERATALRARIVVVDSDAQGTDAAGHAAALLTLRPPALLVGVGHVDGAVATVDAAELSRLRAVLTHVLHDAGDHAH